MEFVAWLGFSIIFSIILLICIAKILVAYGKKTTCPSGDAINCTTTYTPNFPLVQTYMEYTGVFLIVSFICALILNKYYKFSFSTIKTIILCSIPIVSASYFTYILTQ